MICFEIGENANEHGAIVFKCRDGRFGDELFYDIYEHLAYKLEQTHETAEDAASWCELASVNTTYEHEDFYIDVYED